MFDVGDADWDRPNGLVPAALLGGPVLVTQEGRSDVEALRDRGSWTRAGDEVHTI